MSRDFDTVDYRPRDRRMRWSMPSQQITLAAVWFAFGALSGALVALAAAGVGPAGPIDHESVVMPRTAPEPIVRYVYLPVDRLPARRAAGVDPARLRSDHYVNATADAPIGSLACIDAHVLERVENGWVQVLASGRPRRC